MENQYDVIIIGQGYSGLVAAQLASERGLRTANVGAGFTGGLIINVNELDPAPEGEGHSGAELASNIAMANMDKGVVGIAEMVTMIERGGDLWFVETESGTCVTAPHVVIASGARLRKLGVPGEKEFMGRGVSECADCDGPLFRGLEAVVVGGGDSAFQEALALAQFASKVTIIMRGDAPRARAEFVERATAHPKIAQLLRTRVTAIEGSPDKGVESIRVATEEGEKTIPTAGVFIFVGLEPNTSFVPSDLDPDEAGAITTSDDCATSLPGLWAIGAVRSGYAGLLTDARRDAERAVAALSQVRA